MSVIYIPKGAAGEYAELALNIYTGCPHGCTYCYAPRILHIPRSVFHADVCPRKDILERVKAELLHGKFKDKAIHLCFTCDPYPAGMDSGITREIIKAIKAGGANVQILTKNSQDAIRDFDLLNSNDRFGVTLTSTSENFRKIIEPNASTQEQRIYSLYYASILHIQTWVSFEPVIRQSETLDLLALVSEKKIADIAYIGKINYGQPQESMNWSEFVTRAEAICRRTGQKYVIKQDLLEKVTKNI